MFPAPPNINRTGVVAGFTLTTGGDLVTLAGSLSNPQGVAVDGSGNLYFSNSGEGQVYKLSASTHAITLLSAGLSYPYGLAVYGGYLYIADAGANAILKVPVGGGTTTTIAMSGISPALNAPTGVALDASGNIYIADSGNNAIRKWTVATSTMTTLAAPGTPTGLSMGTPMGLVLDASGNVYFSDQLTKAIRRWNISGGTVSLIISAGLLAPAGVAIDGAGNLYIADPGTAAITKWNGSTLVTLAQADLSGPTGVAVDGAGDVFVADTGDGDVRQIIYASAFTPAITIGVLFAQGTMYAPSVTPILPAAPANAHSWLFYNSSTGFYWHSTSSPVTAGDAALGWIVTNASGIVAISNQMVTAPSSSTAQTVIPLGSIQPTGPGTGGGSGTGPAPNITAATAVPFYSTIGGVAQVGLSGSITLPLTNPLYPNLSWIFVFVWPPGATSRPSQWAAELLAPFPGLVTSGGVTTIAWQCSLGPNAPGGETFPKVEFVCVNGAGQVTPSPFTLTSIVATGGTLTGQISGGAGTPHYAQDLNGNPAVRVALTWTNPVDPLFSYCFAYLDPTGGTLPGQQGLPIQFSAGASSGLPVQFDIEGLTSTNTVTWTFTLYASDALGNLNTTSPDVFSVTMTYAAWLAAINGGTTTVGAEIANCTGFGATLNTYPVVPLSSIGAEQWSLSVSATLPSDTRLAIIQTILKPAITTPAANMAAGDLTVNVTSGGPIIGGGALVANGDYIQIESEIIKVTAGGGSLSWTIARAQMGTTAAAHAAGIGMFDLSQNQRDVVLGPPQINPGAAQPVMGPIWPMGNQCYYIAYAVSKSKAGAYNTYPVWGVTPQTTPFLVQPVTSGHLNLRLADPTSAQALFTGASQLLDADFLAWPYGWNIISGVAFASPLTYSAPFPGSIGLDASTEVEAAVPIPCKAGDNLTASINVRLNGTPAAGLTFYLQFYDNTGARITSPAPPSVTVPGGTGGAWFTTPTTVSGTAPSNAAFVGVRFVTGAIGSGNAFAVAHVVLGPAPASPLALDANGNLTIAPSSLNIGYFSSGNHPTFSGSGTQSTGIGATTSGSTALSLVSGFPANPGTGNVLVVTGYGVPPGTTITANFGTSSPTLSQLANATAPAGSTYTFVVLPSPSSVPPGATSGVYPTGCFFFDVSNGRMYQLNGSWVDTGDPGDIAAGRLAVGVEYAGTVNVQQLVAGSGTFTGTLSFINGSGPQVQISSTGVVLQGAASGPEIQITASQILLSTGATTSVSVNSSGYINTSDTGGNNGYMSASNVQFQTSVGANASLWAVGANAWLALTPGPLGSFSAANGTLAVSDGTGGYTAGSLYFRKGGAWVLIV